MSEENSEKTTLTTLCFSHLVHAIIGQKSANKEASPFFHRFVIPETQMFAKRIAGLFSEIQTSPDF
ncbi:hypothetical protein NDI45_03185 [Leptolyngbya sp. GB1-A1]|uniref:hypothetical protein n=1 Tax=Leptolyngbya sp. GB1-A1 TaxID=2933908 RepID=UPI00329A62C9